MTPQTDSAPPPRSLIPASRVIAMLVLLAALLGVSYGYLNFLSSHQKLFVITDFSHHGWLSGRVVLGGGSPYDAQGWLQAHWTPEYDRDIGYDYATGHFVNVYATRPGMVYNPKHVSEFLYPIWMAYFFSPFALLSLFPALVLFMVLNEVAVLVGLWCSLRILNFRPPAFIGALLAIMAFAYHPTFFAIQEGAYGGILFGALMGALYLIQQRRLPWLAGLLMAFCTIKLQVTLVILAFLVLWLLRRRQWAVLGWALGGGVVQWVLPTLLWPGWVGQWLQMTQLASPTVFPQPTLWSLWVAYSGQYWTLLGVITTIAVGAALLWYWRKDLAQGTWTSLPGTFIVAVPVAYYAWDYDYIILLFPWLACWSMVAVGETSRARLWRLMLIAWVLIIPLYIALPINPSDRGTYGLVMPATLLILYLWAQRLNDTRQPIARTDQRLPAVSM